MKLVEALGKTYSVEILGAADRPISTAELSDSLEIPPATCYRRVKQLASVGLLEECQSEADESGRATLYRRTSDGIGIQFGRNPSALTWDYVARLSGISTSPPGASAEGEEPARIVSTPTSGERSHTEASTDTATDEQASD